MVVKILKRVKEIENQAKALIDEAKREAAALYKKSWEEGEKYIKETEENARKEAERIIARAIDEAKTEAEAIEAETKKKIKAIEERAVKGRAQARDLILEKIRGGLWL